MGAETKEKKPILKKSNETTKKQKACWYFILCCPLICLTIFDIILVSIINQQFTEQKELENQINIIIEPFVAYDKIIINCTSKNPCNITCDEYFDMNNNELNDCNFSYILLCICIIVIIICNCPVLCKLTELICGYICYNYFNKETKHQQIQQSEV